MAGEMNVSGETKNASGMGMSRQSMGGSSEMMSPNGSGGHLYMQTNEPRNVIVHYRRSANGTLTEI